jgi:hypothetical protein
MTACLGKRSPKQEITETIKFLTWLQQALNESVASWCETEFVDLFVEGGHSASIRG